MRRILYVCLDWGIPIGGTKGASIHVAEMLRALEAEGHATAVVARAATGDSPRPLFLAPGLGARPGRTLLRDLRELRLRPALRTTLRRAIADVKPDLVYERYALFRTEGRRESRRAGLPLVLEVNAPLVWEQRRFRRLALTRSATAAERLSWTQADLVVVPSHPMASRVRGLGQDRVLVVPNAVDPERFSSPPPADIRASLGLEGRFVVAFSGSLKAWHDLDTLVDAVARLPEDVRAALLVVGDGPQRARVQARAEAQGLRHVFTGAVSHEDVPRYLAAADACVASLSPDPALDYFSPLKALEYLAGGRPTVVAAVGDLTALAEAGVALAYRAGEATELAARLGSLAADPALRERLAAAGKQYADARTWRAAARTVLAAAESLGG